MDIHFRAWYQPERKMYPRAYQKWFYVLLCEDDGGTNNGKGRPVKRAPYDTCTLMQSTGLVDERGKEIFEGDVLEVHIRATKHLDVVDDIPDMYRSRKLSPLQSMLDRLGISSEEITALKVLGNIHETPELVSNLT
jgi:uncharacterized phage protein (TIGR01671 family)